MKSQRAALKTALLAPSGPVLAWGIQTALAGEVATGLVAVVIGVGMVGGFVVMEEHDIPYESEIIDLISSMNTEEAAKEASETAGEAIEETASQDHSLAPDDGIPDEEG